MFSTNEYIEMKEELEAEVARLRAAFVDAENELDAKHAKLVEVADKLAAERAAHEATRAELQAEVARLREDNGALEALREDMRDQRDRLQLKVDDLQRWQQENETVLATERAAHEANCMHVRRERDEARARVAELEASWRKHVPECMTGLGVIAEQAAALDQARGLLTCVTSGQTPTWYQQRDDWLRAHPATAASCTHDGIGLPGCVTCDPSTGPRPGASNREPARVYGGEGMPDVVLEAEPATPATTGVDTFATRHGDVIDISEKEQGT